MAPLFAANVTVEVLPEQEKIKEKFERLSSLKVGESAEIKGISPNCRGQQRRRLMDFGIVPGTKISAEMQSASGDPLAYEILGATIALRKEHAGMIYIEKTEEPKN